jgi:hypothetical protein
MATAFNETVALDLKIYRSGYMLHLIDHATRFSQACLIKNKQSGTIVKAILKFWIGIFGSPHQFLSDNGGEFVNAEFNELAEKFNIKVLTTAAESPWSNGLCEKHNGIIADMIQKTMSDGVCDLELAIHWCVAAKNSLLNVYGYSPNQLVFGRNTNYPAVYSDKPPAQNQSTTSEHIFKNLQALHAARESFIKQESCERLRRALTRKTRNTTHFLNGDSVYYKRNDNNEWHGPAKVLGKDAQQYLLKHGGVYIRVHPCRMQLTSTEASGTYTLEDSSEKSVNTTRSTASASKNDDHAVSDSDEEGPSTLHDPVIPPTHPANLTQPVVTPPSQPTPDPNIDGDNFDAPATEVDQHIPQPQSTPIPAPQKPSTALKRLQDFNRSPVHLTPSANSQAAQNCSKPTVVKTVKDLPHPQTSISYKNPSDEEWKCAEVVSKAGKATTNNWHYMNIREEGEEDARCVSLKGVQWRIEEQQQSEDIFFGTVGVRFEGSKLEEMQKWRDMGAFEEVPDTGQPRISCPGSALKK